MAVVKSYDEFLGRIRILDESLKNIKVKEITVNKSNKTIVYSFICDKPVSAEVKKKIADEVDKMTSGCFSDVSVRVEKISSDGELVNIEVFSYLKKNYPSISIFLDENDVSVLPPINNVVKYILKLSKDGAEYVIKNGALKSLDKYLSMRFCSEFIGITEIKPETESVDILSESVYESELQRVSYRTYNVENVRVIDDMYSGNTARYIEDVEDGSNTVAGVITRMSEKTTSKGKPFFVMTIDDTTGQLSGVYFTKKNTLLKIKELKEGDSIIVRGTYGDYKDGKSFTFEKINGCDFPSNFVKVPKSKKSAPRNYKNVFPVPSNTVKVQSVFDEETIVPTQLLNIDFVVLDIETTGLNPFIDEITEIGAVKIKNGKIVEHFNSLIKVGRPLSPKIVELTGITDEMLKDALPIEEVLPDFLKFADGTVVVVHNADFDPKFIKRFAGELDYEFSNKILDTIVIARRVVPDLKKYDLHTLADKFGIVFRHHRALSDAYATAEAFIEMAKIGDIE